MKDLTIVVCAKNSEDLIEECLRKIKQSAPNSELIVVDANSPDNTAKIAKKYTNKVLLDNKRGLSYARQLGIDNAQREFVAFVGPDNLMSRKILDDSLREIKSNKKIAGVQPLTIIRAPKNYWEMATKCIFDFLLNTPGPVEVLGTPCIFRKEVVSKIRYDESITGGCDDTDLSLRIRKAGFILKQVNVLSYEEQNLNFKKFFSRWRFYGNGDAEFYRKYKKSWTFKRKIKSVSHPFRKYIWKGFLIAIQKRKPILIPALIMAVFARYYGWITKR